MTRLQYIIDYVYIDHSSSGNEHRHNVCFYAEMCILRLTVCVMMQNGRNYNGPGEEKQHIYGNLPVSLSPLVNNKMACRLSFLPILGKTVVRNNLYR